MPEKEPYHDKIEEIWSRLLTISSTVPVTHVILECVSSVTMQKGGNPMSLDGICIRAIVHELNQTLLGSRVTKIYQPGELDLVMHMRSKNGNRRLLLSAHPAYPRLYLTEQPADNPLTPPMFCMLLRKHCEGGVIESIQQVGLERIIYIDIKTRNELGDEVIRRLIVEIMGRHSNIMLIDPATDRIMDAIRRVTPDISRHRQVMPVLFMKHLQNRTRNVLWKQTGIHSSVLFNSTKESWISKSSIVFLASVLKPHVKSSVGRDWVTGRDCGPHFIM